MVPKGYENHANFKILVHFFGTVRNGNNVIVNYISKYNTIPAEWPSAERILNKGSIYKGNNDA